MGKSHNYNPFLPRLQFPLKNIPHKLPSPENSPKKSLYVNNDKLHNFHPFPMGWWGGTPVIFRDIVIGPSIVLY